MTFNNESIWIIGASSGIGRSLAHELAAGGAKLILSARSEDKLQTLKAELSGDHHVVAFDVANLEETTAAAGRTFALGTIDRIIILAALYKPMKMTELDMETTHNILQVNLGGTFNVVHAVLPELLKQKKAQLALCGSVAGYIGLPKGQPYSATKAGIINLAESLRAECPDHVDIKLISPGFVKTQLTDMNDFDMPMIIEPQQAARAIVRGLQSCAFEIHFPKRFTCLLKCIKLLPYFLLTPLLKRL